MTQLIARLPREREREREKERDIYRERERERERGRVPSLLVIGTCLSPANKKRKYVGKAIWKK